MLYREFGKTKEKVSILGYGCMRLPCVSNNNKSVDEKEAIKQIRYAIDNGVNYIDTAYIYNEGISECVVGKALKDGYRQKIYLADKLPSWLIKSREDMDKCLNEQLEKLSTNYIDFYLLHALNKEYFENLKKNNVFDFLESAVSSGKIKYIGFSFHDELDIFKEIVDYYPWSFCQIQYNYLDKDYQAGEEGLKYASQKGLGIVIMEPLRGGSIATNIPKHIKDIWEEYSGGKKSPVYWALKFLWNYPQIHVVLSGMNNMDHIKENINIANKTKANSLNKEELNLIEKVKKEYESKIKIRCTGCNYCMPCDHNVDIPNVFKTYNDAYMFEDISGMKDKYNKFLEGKASNCIKCGKCEKSCPQHIQIRRELEKAIDLFENNK
ncbi:aldo/keto reductase [Clostridium rectalis]|uniref:aldo/keto reductase n=1 Tax=Clostridium rectalis TaxID=2040295 RepID=UPI000F638C1A|nr:aldo/keto reductase [Clostridium rectalis]